MQQEVEALLALQEDDLKIREIENQIRALDPQLADFDKRKEQAVAAITRAEAAVLAEEKKQREIQGRLSQHKQLQERNLHQLEDVKRMREATAATAQVEATRRMMAEDESELAILGRRLHDMNAQVAAAKQTLQEVEEAQKTARPEI
jgi:predicted  nucleic acid-binding Zn-ribbon protein